MSEAQDPLVYEVDLDARPDEVWRAIATPEVRETWLGPPETGEAETGPCEPGRRLDLVWPTREGESLIRFEISAGEAGGSRLTITHWAPAMASVLTFPARVRRTTPIAGWRMAA